MVRLCIFFAGALMLSAISLVTARYQSRQLFITSETLQAQAQTLETDWRRLQLERAGLTRNARIDDIARNELKMRPVSPDRTIYLQGRFASVPAGAGALPGGRP